MQDRCPTHNMDPDMQMMMSHVRFKHDSISVATFGVVELQNVVSPASMSVSASQSTSLCADSCR